MPVGMPLRGHWVVVQASEHFADDQRPERDGAAKRTFKIAGDAMGAGMANEVHSVCGLRHLNIASLHDGVSDVVADVLVFERIDSQCCWRSSNDKKGGWNLGFRWCWR